MTGSPAEARLDSAMRAGSASDVAPKGDQAASAAWDPNAMLTGSPSTPRPRSTPTSTSVSSSTACPAAASASSSAPGGTGRSRVAVPIAR